MNLTGRVHVNVNRSDFERSRAFYERLGFKDPDGTVLELVEMGELPG